MKYYFTKNNKMKIKPILTPLVYLIIFIPFLNSQPKLFKHSNKITSIQVNPKIYFAPIYDTPKNISAKKQFEKTLKIKLGNNIASSKINPTTTPSTISKTKTTFNIKSKNITKFVKLNTTYNSGNTTKQIIKDNGVPNNGKKLTPTSEDTREEEGQFECFSRINKITVENLDLAVPPSSKVKHSIYPGALYKLSAFAQTGNFVAEQAPREKMSIFTDAILTEGQNYIEADPSNPAYIMTAQNQLINRISSNSPTVMSARFSKIHNEEDEQVQVSMGGSYMGFEGSSMFDYSNNKVIDRILIDINLDQFSIGAFPMNQQFFKDQVNASNYNPQTSVYVGAVTYGKRCLIAMETTSESYNTMFKANAKYENLVGSFSLSSLYKYHKLIEESKINIMFIGGSGNQNGMVVKTLTQDDNGLTDFNRFINLLSTFLENTSPQSAFPISFSLFNLNGDLMESSTNIDEVPQRTCELRYQWVEAGLYEIDAIDSDDGIDGESEMSGWAKIKAFGTDGEIKDKDHLNKGVVTTETALGTVKIDKGMMYYGSKNNPIMVDEDNNYPFYSGTPLLINASGKTNNNNSFFVPDKYRRIFKIDLKDPQSKITFKMKMHEDDWSNEEGGRLADLQELQNLIETGPIIRTIRVVADGDPMALLFYLRNRPDITD